MLGQLLYYLGEEPVRGFAVVLMIGIITSVFTSIFITRLIFSFFMDNYRTPNLTFSYRSMPMFLKMCRLTLLKMLTVFTYAPYYL